MKAIAARADEGSTQAEERLRLEESLRLVIETTPALVHSALPDGSLDFFNRRWLQYLGRSLEDVQGWGWTGVIHPEDVAGIVDKWRTALATGELFEAEARVRRADGEYRWFLPGARLPRGPCNVACRSELSRILAIPLAGRTSNAACHAKPTVVSVTLRWDAPNLILQVKDNGSGITKARLEKSEGFGLDSMRDRAAQIDAKLEIQTAAGHGTSIIVTVPIS